MKKKFIILISFLALTLSSCNQEISSSDISSSPINEHICEHVCPECGKCMDLNCTNEVCANKCQGHEVDLEILLADEYLQTNKEYSYAFKDDVDATLMADSKDVEISKNTIKLLSDEKVTLTATFKDQIVIKEVYGISKINEITSLTRENYYLNYFGRNVHTDEKVIMNNGGNGFEVSFYGTSLNATMDAWYGSWYGKTSISVMVDGNTDFSKKGSYMTLKNGTIKTEYTLCSGLEDGYHTVKVYKRSEGISSDLSLYSLKTDGYFMPVNKDEKLNLEVYGDSISAGYGNLRGEKSDTTSSTLQDAMETYAGYLATMLDANINMMARTGIGLYTSSSIEDGNNVIDLYTKTSFEGTDEWNFDNYIPDVVLINLGTNDNWNSGFNQDLFITYYCDFIRDLASKYGPDTSFILLSGFMESEVSEYLSYVIYYLEEEIDNKLYQFTFDRCKGGHPRNYEHLDAAKALLEFMQENGLDIHHQKEEKNYSEIKNTSVDYELTIETSDALGDYLDLYVSGLGNEDIKLTKTDTFKYQSSLNILDGDYDLEVYLNEDKESKSIGKYVAHVRIDNKCETILVNSFINVPSDPNPNASTNGWALSKHLFEVKMETSPNEIKYYNTNWMAAFAYHQAKFNDNVSYTFDLKGDFLSSKDQVFAGFCPYYNDDRDFIVLYLQWNSDGSFKSIGCTGIVKGVDIGWNDYWSFANKKIDYQNNVSINITRKGKDITVNINGVSETKSFACLTDVSKYYAIWGQQSNITFSNIVSEEV